MRLGILILAVLIAITHKAFASPTWPNEPAGSRQLLDCPFNDNSCDDQFWTPVSGSILQPGGGTPLSSPNALAQRLAVNSATADATLMWPKQGMGQEISEIYVGLWWKMNAAFQGYNSGSNKVFFIRSLSYPFGKDQTNGVFTLLGQPDQFPWQLIFGPNTTGLDNTHTCSDGGLFCKPNVSSLPIYPDTWYHIEAYVKSSTCSTCRNATVRWWVNGTLAGNYTNLNYGSGVVNEVVMDHTWDGQPSASCYDPVSNPRGRDCSREWIHYFDHLRISNPNCGPAGCPAPAYLVITSSTVPGRAGAPYSVTLTADGGTKPYTWFRDTGNLPAGLTLNQNTGVISGTPTCVGRSDFTIRVTDASSPALTATKSYSIITSGTGASCTSTLIAETEPKSQPKFIARGAPGTVTFTLPVTSSGQNMLSIYDLTGKKIYEHRSMGQKEMSISKGLKNGVYVAKLVQGSQTSAVRFQVMN